MKKSYKIYGVDGHRQRESFGASEKFDFSTPDEMRKITVLREDVTGTNDYVVIEIECDTEEQIERELNGQISDGLFENSRVGKIEEITPDRDLAEELFNGKFDTDVPKTTIKFTCSAGYRELTQTHDEKTLTGILVGNNECFENDEFYQFFISDGKCYKAYYELTDENGEQIELDEIEYEYPVWFKKLRSRAFVSKLQSKRVAAMPPIFFIFCTL